jgi:CheY-like chemotaxis protein
VAKILVADDNSNVQKTMALALADHGVEVISVNNGEAAVRKLAEVSPDLVLADIFMPVRNGYEVCEYVKKDSRFSHVPVILLVGAFDPLDEREAQRVGADGILKKPFVPPDPLIAMVKALLDRSMSARLVAVPASKAPVPVPVKAVSRTVPEAHVPPPPIPEEPSPEEFPASGGPVSFGQGDRPVAFGQLLEPPARATSTSGATDVIEPIDDEQVLTSSRDATLGEPVFWRNDSAEVEPEAEQSADSKDDPSSREWGEGEDSLPRREDAALLRPVEPLELVRDEEETASPSLVDSEPIVLDPAAQAPLTVESGTAPELAANPIEWMATAPPQHPNGASETTLGWDEQSSGGLQVEPAPGSGGPQVEPAPFPDALKPMDAVEPIEHTELAPEVAAEPETRKPNPTAAKISVQSSPVTPSTQAPDDTARSVPVVKWAEMTDSLADRAVEILTPRVVPTSVTSAHVPAPTEPISQPAKPAASLNLQGSSPAATPNPAAIPNPEQSASQEAAPQAPDAELVEAVVQRVLDKMRPQVVDIITKEFLRPVVQALVHREIEKH